MDKLVKIFAPRGRVDFVVKVIGFLLSIGALNWLRDIIEHGENSGGFLNSLEAAVIVGIMPSMLSLALIGHLNKLQLNLEKAAITDPLTGLPNRRGFFDLANASLPEPGGVLMMLDADHFKTVNDSYGHGAGDQCLIQIATLLRSQLRTGDVVARLGGEEFGLLLVGARRQDARAIGERLVKGVSVQTGSMAKPHVVTMSIGAICTAGCDSIAQLLSMADTALYQAKETGRARIVFANQDDPPHGPTAINPRAVA